MTSPSMDFESLIDQDENHRLDFKQADKINDKRDLARHFVALANREGGRLVFGITDEGEIEGASTDEDESVREISTAARLFCDPPVEFTHSYSEINHSGNRGDILEVQISAYSDSPHAVIDPTSKTSRSYYIRVGNESRPLTKNQEISQLFKDQVNPDRSESILIPGVFDYKEFDSIKIKPKSDSTGLLEIALSLLSDSDKEYLNAELSKDEELPMLDTLVMPNGDHPPIVQYLHEIYPFVILMTMSSWSGAIEDAWKRENGEYVLDNKIELQSVSDFEVNHDGEIIEDLELEVDDIKERIGENPNILAPAGTDILVHYSSDPQDGSRRSELVFKKLPAFRHSISVHHPRNSLVTDLPARHPGYITSDPEGKVGHTNFHLSINLNYSFPDEPDPHIEIHSEFGDSLMEYTQQMGFDKFLESTPNSEIFNISKSVEELREQIDDI